MIEVHVFFKIEVNLLFFTKWLTNGKMKQTTAFKASFPGKPRCTIRTEIVQSVKLCLLNNNLLYFFCNRIKTLKKEIKMSDQKTEDRKRKKEEIKKSSATKPKRLSKHQYPALHAVCTARWGVALLGVGGGTPGEGRGGERDIMASASKKVFSTSIANKLIHANA